jgi:hypothetical protein
MLARKAVASDGITRWISKSPEIPFVEERHPRTDEERSISSAIWNAASCVPAMFTAPMTGTAC